MTAVPLMLKWIHYRALVHNLASTVSLGENAQLSIATVTPDRLKYTVEIRALHIFSLGLQLPLQDTKEFLMFKRIAMAFCSALFLTGGAGGGFSGGGARGSVGGGYRGGFYGGRGYYGGSYYRGGLYFGLGGWGYPYYGYYGYNPDYWGYPYYGYYGYEPYYYGYDPYAHNSYPPYSMPPSVPQQNYEYQYPQQGQGQQPTAQPQSSTGENQGQNFYLVAFNDHTIQAATAYKIEGDQIHWITRDGQEKQAPLSSVDIRFSQQLNSDRHVDFRIP
jgi:hypothetical protein